MAAAKRLTDFFNASHVLVIEVKRAIYINIYIDWLVVVVVVVGFSLIVDCDGRSSTSTSQAQTVVPKLGGWKIGEKRFFFFFFLHFPASRKQVARIAQFTTLFSPSSLSSSLSLLYSNDLSISCVRGPPPLCLGCLTPPEKKGRVSPPPFLCVRIGCASAH